MSLKRGTVVVGKCASARHKHHKALQSFSSPTVCYLGMSRLHYVEDAGQKGMAAREKPRKEPELNFLHQLISRVRRSLL